MLKRYDGTANRNASFPVNVYVEDDPGERNGDGDRGAQRHVHDEMEPTTEEKRLVKKLHKNWGHPDPKMMVRPMRLARAKPHIVRSAPQKFRCEVCEAKPKPKAARRRYYPAVMCLSNPGYHVVLARARDACRVIAMLPEVFVLLNDKRIQVLRGRT